MKYNEKNIPLQCMMTNSTCYKGTRVMEVKGILWHSTGANNNTIRRYVQPDDNAKNRDQLLNIIGVNSNKNDWNHIYKEAGLNAWVGKLANGTVAAVQTMPWNYRPWGCGSGKRGSCNNGWIQFEITEDDLSSKEYFTAAYNEACELTAYLCKLYNINPCGYVVMGGVNVPTILCHNDSNKLGLGSDHVDIDHWFPKYGKSMETVRKDVCKLLGITYTEPVEIRPAILQLYDNSKYVKELQDNLNKLGYNAGTADGVFGKNTLAAVKALQKNYGLQVDGVVGKATMDLISKLLTTNNNDNNIIDTTFQLNEVVYVSNNALWSNGKKVPDWVQNTPMYVRNINKDNIAISIYKEGIITGTLNKQYLYKKSDNNINTLKSYKVKITANLLNVRKGPGMDYEVTRVVKKDDIYNIIDEQNGWGKLDSNLGWIALNYTRKV